MIGPFRDAKGRWTVITSDVLTTGATRATHHKFRDEAEAIAFTAGGTAETAPARGPVTTGPVDQEAADAVLLTFLPQRAMIGRTR